MTDAGSALVALTGVWVARAAELRARGLAAEASQLERLAADVGEGLARSISVAEHVPLRDDRLWTAGEAARYLGVSERYLRDCGCPRILLPGNGARGQSLVRFDPAQLREWSVNWQAKTSPHRAA
ncbi:MAG: hypothetical protein ACREND_17645 [Gemmatimonadaceae bacterium]